MKKVIDGKLYNTETAELIHEWDNGGSSGDFDRCDATLYKTKSGAFFLAGSGGARSMWSQSLECGRSQCGGAGIRALTQAEALEWCENHGADADLITEHFEIEEA